MARTLKNKEKKYKIFPNTVFMSKHNIECLAKRKMNIKKKNKKGEMFYWRHTLCMEQPHFVFSFCFAE